MTLTKTRLVDLDDDIDLGFGKTLREQITDQSSLLPQGTGLLAYTIGLTEASSNTELIFGDYNGSNQSATLRYNTSTNRLVFSRDPDNISFPYQNLVLANDLSALNSHLSDTNSTLVHGGFVAAIKTKDVANVDTSSNTKGNIVFKDTLTLEYTNTSGVITSEVINTPAIQNQIVDWTDGSFTATTDQYVCFSGQVIFDPMVQAEEKTKVLSLPTGYEIDVDASIGLSLVRTGTLNHSYRGYPSYQRTSATGITIYVVSDDPNGTPQTFTVNVTAWLKKV